jgi:hypothetical protein
MRITAIADSRSLGRPWTLEELAARYRMTARDLRIFTRFHHFERVWLAPEATLSELLQAALDRLRQGLAPDYLCYGHSLHDNNVAGRGLLDGLARRYPRQPELLAVTQGACASGALALRWLQRQLQPGQQALWLSGEKCFHPLVQYVGQNACFGEIAVAVVLEAAPGPGWHLVAAESGLIGGYALRTVQTSREAENRYDHAFLPAMLALVRRTLAQVGLAQADIAAIVPYHASPVSFDRLAEQAGFGRERVFREHLYSLGHCFCSDVFLNLGSAALTSRLTPLRRHVLALAAGLTGTLVTLLFAYREVARHEDQP